MNLAGLIDHTLLKPTAAAEDIIQLCTEAKRYKFYSVCVNPKWVKLAKKQGVRVCTVIGFPLGANALEIKIAEIKQALKDGSDELDVVLNNVPDLKTQTKEIVKAAGGRLVKIIIETCYLTDKEKIEAAKLVKASGAAFVKTSTGFGPSGATVEDVKLLRKTVGPNFGVKASGGIKTKDQALAMVAAGANRLGTSSGIEICR